MAGSNWTLLLPHMSPTRDQVEKQSWETVQAWSDQLEGKGDHTSNAQELLGSRCSVTDTTVYSPYLVEAKRERGWQDTLPLV